MKSRNMIVISDYKYLNTGISFSWQLRCVAITSSVVQKASFTFIKNLCN